MRRYTRFELRGLGGKTLNFLWLKFFVLMVDLFLVTDNIIFLLKSFFRIPIIGDLWWLWSFLFFSFLASQFWLIYRQELWRRTNIRWVVLEIRMPRELRKTPRAMEQVFTAIHGIRNNPSSWKEKWWDGEVSLWFSAEIVSFGGEIHFYMVVPENHKEFVEAALYAQYTDIEIVEAEDYITRLPPTMKDLKEAGYTLFGNELILAKPDAYPIRSYIDFEATEEEKTLDPISALLETIAKIKPQETIWIQILFRPKNNDSWKQASEKLVDELIEKIQKRRGGKSELSLTYPFYTTGDKETIEAIERNISKPGFDALIRYIYVAPKEIAREGFARRGVYSAFNQYATEHLNKFKHNVKTWTKVGWYYYPWFFPQRRKFARQTRIYYKYRNRWIYDDDETSPLEKFLGITPFDWGLSAHEAKMTLNTEELATIYHLPTNVVLTAPLLKRVEARKISPPPGLPIYGKE